MPELYFNVGAEEELARLAVDVGRGHLYERVNDILDAIENDHTAGELRRRRFAEPPLWAVKVHGSGLDYLVLWRETNDGVLIHYIGTDVF